MWLHLEPDNGDWFGIITCGMDIKIQLLAETMSQQMIPMNLNIDLNHNAFQSFFGDDFHVDPNVYRSLDS